MKLKFNQNGFTHGVVLMAVVVLFAIAGVGFLVISNANAGLPAPTGVKLSSTNTKAVLVDWDDNAAKSADFSYYAVRRSTTTTDTKQPGWTRMLGNLKVSQFTDTTVVAGKKYNYYVVAFNKARLAGARSQVVTITAGGTGSTPAPNPNPNPEPNPDPTPGDKSAFWTMDFSNKQLGTMKTGASEPWYSSNTFRPERLQIVNDPLGKYGKVMKAETFKGEYIGGDSRGTRSRAEAFYPTVNGQPWKAHPGDDIWYGWRFMEDSTNYCIGVSTTQFKGMNPDSGAFGGFVRSYSNGHMHLNFGSHHIWDSQQTIESMRGQWYDIVFHHKFSTTSSGITEMWFGPAGSPVRQSFKNAAGSSVGTTYNGPNVFGNNDQPPTSNDIMFKQGVYGDASKCNSKVDFYYSMTRIGHSYAAVVPR